MRKHAWAILLLCWGPFWLTEAAFWARPQAFYFRPWEYFMELANKSYEIKPVWHGNEYGDQSRFNFFLYQERSLTDATTDEDGFRSVPFKAEYYPVVVGGDSNVYGQCLSDSETLPWRLSETLQTPVFNAGRIRVKLALRNKCLSRPKLVIDCVAERVLNYDLEFRFYGTAAYFLRQPILSASEAKAAVPAERRQFHYLICRWGTGLLRDLELMTRLSPDGPVQPMLFNGNHKTPRDLEMSVAQIVIRDRWMKRHGYRYLFVPVPDKDSIYKTDLDDFTRGYTAALVHRLRLAGVDALDLNKSFREARSGPLLEFKYDSHWTAAGVEIAASEITKHIRTHHLLR